MPKGHSDPYWLNPKDPRYWDYYAARIQETAARFENKDRPEKITFELDSIDRMIVNEAIEQARVYTGAANDDQAFIEICEDYLGHGPHARAQESVSIKAKMTETNLEKLFGGLNPRHIITAFNRAHPAYAILDFPK